MENKGEQGNTLLNICLNNHVSKMVNKVYKIKIFLHLTTIQTLNTNIHSS